MLLFLSTPSARFPVHYFSASSSHVYPPSSWLDLDSAVFIYPPHQHFPLHLASFPHLQSPSLRNRCRTHSLSSPLLTSPNPRAPLQSESRYNDLPSCLLPSPFPLDLAFVIWRLESNRHRFTFLRYAPSLLISQPCTSIRDCFLLSFLLSVKAAHKRRVFWICSLVGCIWTCMVGKLSNVRMLNSPGLITSLDAI